MFSRTNFSTESGLIKGCLKGDRMAQRHLYDSYSGKFLAICIRYLKDREHAEDVMLEGFMKIFEKLPQYQAKGSFEGWMKRIMVTQALMTLRSNRHLMMEVNMESGSEYQDQNYELNHMETADLMQMVESLPVGYRTVFNLYAIEGFSHQEIANLLGITESTSKSQLNRARKTLKEKIASQNPIKRKING
ncbi:sigma-70 family RNA polymerase sigma factor [Algoriphagus halophytocola]|uniref:Sigma-70 family RNA polymerase sigma factor n=1 Tax=Algoriphagus halophytocola TaxID=2991499 RepID=A0ABY6MMV2_9BACT|nr:MULTISPECIES: sigma-70 family RNA polymerase sigma factor [unclassified Algoriphagus]UZD24329.1 sigma-70 family RNA polymerase sigma factor [Algoriphagus sp. TR-M5]WBL41698.1 sigma-70 family RNA polymerase sigma factor [Algoriphagus sp. TR-M9]